MAGDGLLKVLLIGDYPPPYGGISVQIQNLQYRIRQLPEFTCTALNIGASRKTRNPECLEAPNAISFLRTLGSYARQHYILHIITNGHNLKSWLCAFACSAFGLLNRRRTIIALDSGAMADFVTKAGWPLRVLISITLRLAGAIICRNQKGREVLLRLGSRADRTVVLPGYFPSDPSNLEAISPEIKAFISSRQPIIGTIVAFRPEYRTEMLLTAIQELAQHYPSIGLIIIGSGGDDGIIFNNSQRVMVVRDVPHPICLAIMSRLSVFARCTDYDGDAISVREALSLGIPVVASDTDFRPDGVVKFRIGDSEGLTKAIRSVLSPQKRGEDLCFDDYDPSEAVLKVYRGLLKRKDILTMSRTQ